MHPVLFKIGPLTLHSYGLMVAIGYLTGVLLAARAAPRFGLDREKVVDSSFYLILFSIIGGRAMFVLVNWSYYWQRPLEIFFVWQGGLVYYGGLIVTIIGLYFWLRRQKIDIWNYGDLIAPHIALGHAIGRVGCFLNGCCYGMAVDRPWGMVFPSLDGGPAAPRLPIQLLSSACNLILYFLLRYLWRYRRFKGETLWFYVLFYSLLRFVLEFLRADPRGGIPGTWISTSQVIAVVGLGLSSFFLWKWRRAAGHKLS